MSLLTKLLSNICGIRKQFLFCFSTAADYWQSPGLALWLHNARDAGVNNFINTSLWAANQRPGNCHNEPIRGLETVTRHIEYIMLPAKKLPSLCLCPCHVSTHATCHEASHWSAFRLAALSLADCYRLPSGYWFDHLTTATLICGENNYQVSVSETWRGVY